MYARLGRMPRTTIEAAYWASPARTFEYWSHAASILPIEDWPLYAMRRARYAKERPADADARREVLDRLTLDGPLTARQMGGARQGGPWWDWSPVKRAAERMLATGELVCVERRSWHRIYDLAERAVPADLRAARMSDDECKIALARRAAEALGVATLQDLADYHRQRPSHLRRVIALAELVPVTVDGWDGPAWASQAALDGAAASRERPRTTLLSPFDSLVWDRARTERIFGMRHRLEAYVPAPDRVHGYFAMPVLSSGRLVGRVDPARERATLVARRVTVERVSGIPGIARAIVEAAGWVGCTDVRVERVEPPALDARMRAALTAATRSR